MSTCARCGLESAVSDRQRGLCTADAEGELGPGTVACRDRELANLRSLLRSVTGKLEEATGLLAGECVDDSPGVRSAIAILDGVLEVLS